MDAIVYGVTTINIVTLNMCCLQNDISNIVCRLLESGCATVGIAAKCFALLSHIGSGGSQGLTHKTAWGQQQLVIVAKIHDVLDDLFANINEIQVMLKRMLDSLLACEYFIDNYIV